MCVVHAYVCVCKGLLCQGACDTHTHTLQHVEVVLHLCVRDEAAASRASPGPRETGSISIVFGAGTRVGLGGAGVGSEEP